MKHLLLILCAAGCALNFFSIASAEDDPLATLKPGHPRLIATASTWADLKTRRAQDKTLDRLLTRFEAEGRLLLDQPPVIYKKTGRRLLAVSREAEQRIVLLSFDYRLTGDAKFLHRAEQEMLAVAAFQDWNPSHFLDVAEMTAAEAIGYDWLFDALSPATRDAVRQAIIDKGLRQADDLKLPTTFWYHAEMNWNQVCTGGMSLGALAIGDEAPDEARKILTLARANVVHGMKPYTPHGVYPEGPGYWSYGTSYSVLLISALRTALGTDWGLPASPGFLESSDFLLQATAPTRLYFDYSDGGPKAELQPALYWFARERHRPDLLRFQAGFLEKMLATPVTLKIASEADRFIPLLALWSDALDQAPPPPTLPLNWHVASSQPLAVFRGSWTDPATFYLGCKGGSANLSHGHMDAGSFVYDDDGVRWAEDLGSQDYESIESKGLQLFSVGQNTDRWKVFRLTNFAHNTLTIDGQLQKCDGYAPIIRFSATADDPHVVIDLSTIYQGQVTKALRGFKVLPNHQLLIQDELTGLTPGADVRWKILTKATVAVHPGFHQATLSQHGSVDHSGHLLVASLVSPPDATLVASPADPPPQSYDALNPGITILTARMKAPASGTLRIDVVLSRLSDAARAASVPTTPCETWSSALTEPIPAAFAPK